MRELWNQGTVGQGAHKTFDRVSEIVVFEASKKPAYPHKHASSQVIFTAACSVYSCVKHPMHDFELHSTRQRQRSASSTACHHHLAFSAQEQGKIDIETEPHVLLY